VHSYRNRRIFKVLILVAVIAAAGALVDRISRRVMQINVSEICIDCGEVRTFEEYTLGGWRIHRTAPILRRSNLAQFMSNHRAEPAHDWMATRKDTVSWRRRKRLSRAITGRLAFLEIQTFPVHRLERAQALMPDLVERVHRDILHAPTEDMTIACARALDDVCDKLGQVPDEEFAEHAASTWDYFCIHHRDVSPNLDRFSPSRINLTPPLSQEWPGR
jgi:hypothetical protein